MAILAIDQGTTSSRAVIFADDLTPRASAQQEFPQHFPRSGWVEHDPEDLWATTAATARAAIEKSGNPALAAIGITNQRETTVVWDRRTGRAIHNAIVWQDRRTADLCGRLKEQGHEPAVSEATGLLLDPYFSATKVAWILDHVDGARGGRRRAPCVRDRRQLPDLAADGRAGACDRRHQRLAHHALRHPARRLVG